MKKAGKIFAVLVVIIMALSLVLSFDAVGAQVGKMFNVAGGVVTYWAKTVFGAALGIYLITSGVAALAVPLIGVVLIVIGLVLVGYTLWPLFSRKSAE